MQLEITHFTDPACPFVFSAELVALSRVAKPIAAGADFYWAASPR